MIVRFIKKIFLNLLHEGEDSSMDLRHIEKKLFACILLVSVLCALMVTLVKSLLSLSILYFQRFDLSENQLAFINIAIVLNMIFFTVFGISACLRSIFHKNYSKFSLDKMPKFITTYVSEFIKGYKEL